MKSRVQPASASPRLSRDGVGLDTRDWRGAGMLVAVIAQHSEDSERMCGCHWHRPAQEQAQAHHVVVRVTPRLVLEAPRF